MNKKYTLKKNHDIEVLISYKMSVGNKYFAVYYHYEKDTKIAVSVSKKLGKAFFRNYLKRVTKEILRINFDKLQGMHVLLVVKKGAIDLSYEDKCKEITKLINKIKVENK